MKFPLILVFALFVTGCDSYDSFAECMNDYEARAGSAHAVCPECDNDWRKYVKKLWSAVPNIDSLIRKPTTLSRTN